ncbi:hypothetical protein AB0D67_28995 [Streptosporangium sp. NPDC048047]|uniref:hypothetical protein n=1 Tax=Streptosporangium sp. NPDC048047 TaxID=3155748 RepID=UPI003431A77F
MIDLATVTLTPGDHSTREDGVCLLEAVAWVAGEPHSDEPRCVSPLLTAYGRQLNDVLPDDKRQLLRPLIPLMIGTAGDGHDEARSYLALDWLIRTYTAEWLSVTGFAIQATALHGMNEIRSMEAVWAAAPVIRAISNVPETVTTDLIGEATWGVAWYAAYAATSYVWEAAQGTAWNEALAIVWDAVWEFWHAVECTAKHAPTHLWPVVDRLQDSAISLYQRMIIPV